MMYLYIIFNFNQEFMGGEIHFIHNILDIPSSF